MEEQKELVDRRKGVIAALGIKKWGAIRLSRFLRIFPLGNETFLVREKQPDVMPYLSVEHASTVFLCFFLDFCHHFLWTTHSGNTDTSLMTHGCFQVLFFRKTFIELHTDLFSLRELLLPVS